MSALSIDIQVAAIDTTNNVDPKVVNQTLSFAIKITSQDQFRTIYHDATKGGDEIAGFLYVPTVSEKGCNPTDLIPSNVTRQDNLPQGSDYGMIGYAPWISSACSHAYLEAANDALVNTKGFIFYPTPSNQSNMTLSSQASFELQGGYDFVQYPVYAVDPQIGQLVMNRLSQYSGNVTNVYLGHNLTGAGVNPQDYVRVFADIKTENSNPMPGLWLFLLIVVAVLLFIVGLTSLVMHLLQYRHRQNLRRRVANGEVDLEALGVKRLTVPRAILSKFPITVFIADPPTPTVPGENQAAVTPAVPVMGAVDGAAGNSTQPGVASSQTGTDTSAVAAGQLGSVSAGGSGGDGAPSDRIRGFSQSTCPICLDDFVHQQTMVRELPCLHVFHPECIDPFLETQSSLCPLCKKSTLPRGYVPSRLTNATVRRERVLRRLRQRSQNANASASASANQMNGGNEMQMVRITPPPQSAGSERPTGRRASIMRALSLRPSAPTDEEEQRQLNELPRWRRIGGRAFPALL